MKIIFMGSPDFSIPSLKKLAGSKKIDVAGVVTQPDKPRGRGQKMLPTPVKKCALELGLKVDEEKNVNNYNFLYKLKEMKVEAVVVVAFGQKLGTELLNLPKYGCINLHASLLPEYRGASPIHRVIIDGRKVTGVTTMYMDKDWDTGDIIYKKEVKIEKDDTAGKLHDKLSEVGAELLLKTLVDIEKGTAPREKQDEEEASYAGKIDKNTGEIDWNKSAGEIYNFVRGLNPWPGAYTFYGDDLIKIWKVEVFDKKQMENYPINISDSNNMPGKILAVDAEQGLLVGTGDGIVNIKKIQLAGKKSMMIEDFLHGYTFISGENLGKKSDT